MSVPVRDRFPPVVVLALVLGAMVGAVLLQQATHAANAKTRNLDLQAFDPHRSDFTCKHEADVVPPIDPEAEQWHLEAMAATSQDLWEENRDYRTAVELWRKAAERKHWKALINLANAYAHGEGVQRDTEQAVQILEQAMKLGIPAAYDVMGTYHMDGLGVKRDASRAYAFWQLAADMGSPAAMGYVGAKLLGGYDNPKTGMWSNQSVGIKMLECGFVQKNGMSAYELGTWLSNIGINRTPDHVRARKILHEGVQFGCARCATYLSGTFRTGEPVVGNIPDAARADRYSLLGDALLRNTDLRLPNLDKVLPLPPAPLPRWDGERQTLIDAAKAPAPAPAIKPTAGLAPRRAHPITDFPFHT